MFIAWIDSVDAYGSSLFKQSPRYQTLISSTKRLGRVLELLLDICGESRR